MLEPEHGAVWFFHFIFSSQKALYVLQPERALEFLRDSPQFSNLHTLLSEQSGQTGKCPMFPSTHSPWLGVLYLCLSLRGIIASSSGDPGIPETGRSLMVDVAYQESGLAFLIVPVTTLGIGRVWDKCVLSCMPLLFLVTLIAHSPPSLLLASVQQPISHLHLEDEATRLQGWSRGHSGLPSIGNLQGPHVLAHLCSEDRGAE